MINCFDPVIIAQQKHEIRRDKERGMKICIMCQSTLLQKALEYYLSEFLCDFHECEMLIADCPLDAPKPVCVVGSDEKADVFKPFTPISLLESVRNFYEKNIPSPAPQDSSLQDPSHLLALLPTKLLDIKDPQLQSKIDSLLQEFSSKIYQTFHDEKDK